MFCVSVSFSQSEERYTVVVNLYQPISQPESELLEEILLTQLEYYLTSSASWEGAKITLSESPKKCLSKLDELVITDVKFHNYQSLSDFKGFSETVKKKLENITSKNYDLGTDNSDSQRTSILNHQLGELLAILRTELMVFGEKDVYESTQQVFTDLTNEEKEAIIKEVENYQDGDLLAPLTIEYSELKEEDRSGAFLGTPSSTDISDRILNLLAENSQRLERLESELLQLEIDGSVQEVAGLSVATQKNDQQLLARLPDSMDFYFYTGSSSLTTATLLQLNEVVEILAQSESIKVVITGFTDSSGAPETNLVLSKKRALAVKNFMAESGMSADRFIINYYGESKSEGDRNEDRRVEIKFFN